MLGCSSANSSPAGRFLRLCRLRSNNIPCSRCGIDATTTIRHTSGCDAKARQSQGDRRRIRAIDEMGEVRDGPSMGSSGLSVPRMFSDQLVAGAAATSALGASDKIIMSVRYRPGPPNDLQSSSHGYCFAGRGHRFTRSLMLLSPLMKRGRKVSMDHFREYTDT